MGAQTEAPRRAELLAPAGDMEKLKFAVAYGADAVYLAAPAFGMRREAAYFDDARLREAVRYCAARGVAVHLTCNTLPRNGEAARLPEFFERAQDAGVTALILADLGAFALAGKYAPRVARHVSTQAGVVNYESARAWHELGAQRVILAREMSLDEIRELRARTPRELEVEAFVHGSMCVSFSGRCLLSSYMTGRDSNRGACAQPCRYRYALVEEKRPGEYWPIREADGGTYIMNSKDLRMIDHLPALLDAGLDSLKIEGRAKTAYYAAVVTNAYRRALDAVYAGRAPDPAWAAELEKISHRHYSTGFFFGQPEQYTDNSRYIRDWSVAAYVLSCDGAGRAVVTQRNRFRAGDELELLTPDGLAPAVFAAEGMEDPDGDPVADAKHPEMLVRLRLPRPAPAFSILRMRKNQTEKSQAV